jgi:hypothetical protein
MKELIDFLNDRKKQGPTLFGPPPVESFGSALSSAAFGFSVRGISLRTF